MKRFVILFLLIFSARLLGSVTTGAPEITVSSDGTNFVSVYSEASSGGDGTTSSSPSKAFVPIRNLSQSAADCRHASSCFLQDLHLNMPVTNVPFLPTYSSGNYATSTIKIRVNYDNTSTETMYLYVGAVIGTNETIVPFEQTSGAYQTIAGSTSSHHYTTFTLDKLCNSDISSGCKIATTLLGKVKPKLAFFLSSDNALLGTTTTTASSVSGNAAFVELQLSDTIYSTRMTLSEIRPGDERATAVYSNGTSMGGERRRIVIIEGETVLSTDTMVYLASTNILAAGENPSDVIHSYVDPATSGELTIKNLTNNYTYEFSLAMEDKFGYTTFLSQSQTVTPLDIEAFLEEHQCYLLSAGFGEDHFVIEYFKVFRDHFLAKFSLGKLFISKYYKSAPHYARLIYQSEKMSFLVRLVAYILYVFLRFAPQIFVGIFLLGLFFQLVGRINELRANKRKPLKFS